MNKSKEEMVNAGRIREKHEEVLKQKKNSKNNSTYG